MGAFLLALAPLLAGITQPLKDWFSYKQQVSQKEQDYKLALLETQLKTVESNNDAESKQLDSRLNATSRSFKQGTFYPLWAIVIFSVLFPSKAEVMWNNFNLIPEWFQWLFLSIYSAIWGLPIVKGGYGAVTDLIQSRRDYKIEKIKAYNDKAFYDTIIKKLYPKGVTQDMVNVFNEALKVREEG